MSMDIQETTPSWNREQIISYKDSTFRRLWFGTEQLPMGMRLHRVKEALETIRAQISWTHDIRRFKHLYFVNGVTEAINMIVPRYPRVGRLEKDYRYLQAFANTRVFESLEKVTNVDAMYLSSPFSGTGKHLNLEQVVSVLPGIPLIIDCSYLWASDMEVEKKIPVNVDFLFYGFSKSHNVADARSAVLVSKVPLFGHDVLQNQYAYISPIHEQLVKVASHQPLNYLYKKHKAELSQLHNLRGLVEGNTNLFALDTEGNRIPWHVDYKRGRQ